MIESLKTKKIAIFNAFFKVGGGAEKLIFDMRNYYHADLFAGALDTTTFNPDRTKTDSFAKALFDPNYSFTYLHSDSKIPLWYAIKRQLYFLLSPKIKQLTEYDIVIFSGNIAFIPGRIKKSKAKLVTYCHTPPRPFTDQLQSRLAKLPFILRPFYSMLAAQVRYQYAQGLRHMDLVISNSINIQNRLKTYLNIDSTPVFPAINTARFQYISTQDYFISYSRLEEMKRIPLLIEAFANMPDKKLVICSGGPLERWIQDQIKTRNLTNITFEGRVSDERLAQLVGNCLAGVVIPVDEDAGITQCEIMAAGKPVIGVKEGGLIETVVDGKTGVLIPANPRVQDLIDAIQGMTAEKALMMKEDSIKQAKQFDSRVFFKKMDALLTQVLQEESK
jgi:glycosyltransferase involved in cell wall biosynthesis